MASVRPDQIQGLPANCSDMSDMLVCLVTPHSSTVTKVGPTPLWSARPKWLRGDVRRDGAPVSRPRVHPKTSFQSSPSLLPPLLLLLKPSVHLILLQFHLSPPEPPNRHPPPSAPSRTEQSRTNIPLCIFLAEFSPHFPSPNLTRSHLLLAASRPLGTPTAQSLRPPSVAFQGCVFHALVAGQAPGDFPRWGLKVGQEPVVWSDVRARGQGFVFGCARCVRCRRISTRLHV